jgi:8-oxo-dGTP pyrophosphatase MutT (NUDIX family)
MLASMRALVQLGYRMRRLLVGALRLRTSGVKVMLFNGAGELLLVRHAYVDRELFLLPGGGIGRHESPAAAAAREIEEELGIGVSGLAPVSVHFSGAEGKRDTVHLFKAKADGEPRPDGVEVVEARYFPLDRLPPNVSPATLRRIAEYRGERDVDGRW